MNIKKIVHVSDIHIRLYKRHAEYKQVFDKLYASLKARDLTDTICVVTGDICHAKTDMSPEMVAVASEFLKTLADMMPTIVIAGNHDLNLANPNRLDALTPIITNLNHKQLHYYKDSGVYTLGNLGFGVNSIIGDSSKWPKVSDVTGYRKIALYHGPVNSAETDAGHVLHSKIIIDQFDGYDMVMLGDIHRTQLLQDKSPNKPQVFYPGSLIQQNHGEALTGHGYAVWDVESASMESFVEIENDYGYMTLTLSDKKTMPSIAHMPKNVRLRLLVGDVDSTFIKKVLSVLKKKHTIVEVAVNKLKTSVTGTSSNELSTISDIHDITVQNKLIEEYIKDKLPDTSDELINSIKIINDSLNGRIADDELPKNIEWKPIRLTFDNLFSYGEGNIIEFEHMNGLYGLFSANATGKTSAFDALCVALYDKSPRAFKGSHIMNTRKDTFNCQLEFEVSGERYFVTRTGSRKKNGEVKVDVDFKHIKDGVETSLNGEDRRDTNATIRSYVGSYEDFVLTALSVQNQNSLFIDTGHSDRKDLLSQFIGLTIFDRLFNLASDEIKEVAGALKSFKKDDFTQRLATIQTNLEAETQIYETMELTRNQFKLNADDIDRKLNETFAQKQSVTITGNYDQAVKVVEQIKMLLNASQTNAEKQRNAYNSAQQRLTKYRTQHGLEPTHSELNAARDKYDTYLKSEDAVKSLAAELRLLHLKRETFEDKLQKLKEHKYDPKCKFCIENVFVKDAQKTQVELTALNATISAMETDWSRGTLYLNEHINDKIGYEDLLIRQKEYSVLLREIDSLHGEHERAEVSLRQFEFNLIEAQRNLENIEKQREAIEINKKLDAQIVNLQQEKKSIDDEITTLESKLRTIHASIEVLKSQREEILKTISETEKLEQVYEAYELYLNVIGRDGLPYDVIRKIIPTLESEVNTILNQIVDFSVVMDVDGKNINGKIVYDEDRTWPLELASGMEKFITSLAIRVALISVSSLPRSNFLIIDEGLGVLDAENLSSMGQLFDILKTNFDFVVLISHLDIVRDIADNLIEISRNDGYSYIKVQS